MAALVPGLWATSGAAHCLDWINSVIHAGPVLTTQMMTGMIKMQKKTEIRTVFSLIF